MNSPLTLGCLANQKQSQGSRSEVSQSTVSRHVRSYLAFVKVTLN